MRSLITLALGVAGALALCALAGCAPEAVRTISQPPAPKPVLVLSTDTPVVQAKQAINLSAAFTNKGQAPVTLLKPVDGATDGMRCVSYQWKVERTDGAKILPVSYGRCGNSNVITEKDFATLKPGDTVVLKEWLSAPTMTRDLGPTGVYRIKLIYTFTPPEGDPSPAPYGGGVRKGKAQEMLKQTAPITVESNWVEITRQ